jgi:hypothetical protein
MGRKMNTARFPGSGTGAPEVQVLTYTAGQTFLPYALVVAAAAGTIEECGADPASILGVALGGAARNPGYGMANDAQTGFVTGRLAEVPVAIANRSTVFSARGVNGGTDPVIPLATHITEQYGVAKTAGGDWVIDFAETVAVAVEIVDIDVDNNFFLFKFLEDVLQRP